MTMNRDTFGERLRELRVLAGISQVEFAKQTGMTQPDLSLLERGKKHVWVDTLFSLATTLGCSADYLMGRTDDPTPPEQQQQPRTPTSVG